MYRYFLELGYDDFYLSRADKVHLTGGAPLFGHALGKTPEQVLTAAGYEPGPLKKLDDEVTLTVWTPKA